MLSDLRQSLYKNIFQKGLIFGEYLKTGTESQQELWQINSEKSQITPEMHESIQTYKRKMNLFVLSGIWCGDCMHNCPIIANIAAASPLIECRFFDNQLFPELREELRILGGTRVPVLLICSEDFFEVTRYGDKTYSTYLKKAMNEVGASCATGIATSGFRNEGLKQDINEWFEIIDRSQKMLRLSNSLRNRYGD